MKKVKLTQVCTPKQWATISTDKLLDNGYPVYGANGQIGYYNKYNHENPTLMITCRGATCGTVNISQPKSYINGNAMCLDNLDNRINLRYMYYQLLNYDFSDVISGSAQPQITREGLEKVWLNFHENEEEQKAIADRLDKVSSLIEKRKTQLAKLDELIKSRFIELFGDPIKNTMGWELHRFDSLCENLDYRRKPITASEREAGIYPYYGASGIVDYVTDYLFDEDILLVSEDGANLLMRSTPIAFSVSGKVWVNNHAHVVRFEKMSMQKYIEVFFSLIDISDHITGSAQPKLNQAKLNAMVFPVPSDDRLKAFLQFVEQTDKSKLAIQKSIEKLEILKKSLMQQYFG